MNQFKAEQYDIVLFILDQIKYYTLWYLDDKDGFILNDEETGIMIFKNESAARLFACQNLLPLADDVTLFFIEESKLYDFSKMDCSYILDFWNIVTDIAGSLGLQFLGDEKNKNVNLIYKKLFYGCNLPSIKGEEPDYHPVWSQSERTVMARIVKDGMKILREQLKN